MTRERSATTFVVILKPTIAGIDPYAHCAPF